MEPLKNEHVGTRHREVEYKNRKAYFWDLKVSFIGGSTVSQKAAQYRQMIQMFGLCSCLYNHFRDLVCY